MNNNAIQHKILHFNGKLDEFGCGLQSLRKINFASSFYTSVIQKELKLEA